MLTILALATIQAGEPRALTTADAIAQIPDAGGTIKLLGDIDFDGVPEVAVRRGDGAAEPFRIDAVSLRDGSTLRTLWDSRSVADLRLTGWDANGDLDGDCVPDLLVGLGLAADGSVTAGCVVAISGRTAAPIGITYGDEADCYGASVAFVGDVDADGVDDYVVGATQAEDADEGQLWQGLYFYGDAGEVLLDGGIRMDAAAYRNMTLADRDAWFGYVSARSGVDGRELWRVNGEQVGQGFGARVSTMGGPESSVLIEPHPLSTAQCVVVTGDHGTELGRVTHRFIDAGFAGDLDRDGAADVYLIEHLPDWKAADRLRFFSWHRGEDLFVMEPLYWLSEYATVAAVGDLDADGLDDIGLGDGDVNMDPEYLGFVPDLRRLTVSEALRLRYSGGCSFRCESGAVVVYSGRTQEPIFGAFGTPGTMNGIGAQVLGLPDVSGDGWRDVLVADSKSAWVFAGPGPR